MRDLDSANTPNALWSARSMTALHDAAVPKPAAHSAADAARADIQDGILTLEDGLNLFLGSALPRVQVAWRLVGAIDAPVVAALGGISAGRYVSSDGDARGWWSEIVGEGGALDTTRFRVLGIDFLGGSGNTTGPRAAQHNFPSVSAYDQAEILRRVLKHVGLQRIHAIVGASYGGMVALAFAERWPEIVDRIISISASDRAHPMSTAWRSVQRAIVRYALSKNDGTEGLRLARALAMATYRSPREFVERFAGAPTEIDGRYTFPVERYLLARGDAYASSYLPEAFVCLSESIDLHRVDPTRIRVPTTLVAVKEDQLVHVEDMRALRERLAGPAQLFEISSVFGHDAFLKETQALRSIFVQVLTPAGETS
jgi:homoserine O-acetyltransferase